MSLKFFENPNKVKDLNSIEHSQQKEQKKETRLLASKRKIPGLILWQFNTVTMELTRASFKKMDYVLDFTKPDPAKDLLTRMKVLVEENCIYFQSLNKENALRKLIASGYDILLVKKAA